MAKDLADMLIDNQTMLSVRHNGLCGQQDRPIKSYQNKDHAEKRNKEPTYKMVVVKELVQDVLPAAHPAG